jgi:hypothetical protein
MSSSTRPMPSRKSSGHRSTLSLQRQRIEITIHVYDLLPPGKVSAVLWAIGSSLLHSGVVVGDREYAYGGHDRRDVSGVYWTKPGLEPPGGTFRQAVLHGLTFRPQEELDAIIHEVQHRHTTTMVLLTRTGLDRVPGHLLQPPHQELQPLHLVPLRKAHRPQRTLVAQPRR